MQAATFARKTTSSRWVLRVRDPARLFLRAVSAPDSLEPRLLFTAFTVTTLADTTDPNDSVLSLREAIAQ